MQWMYSGAKTVPARMSVKDFTVTLWMSLQFIGCNLATWKFWLQEAYIAHILQWRKCGCSISLVQHINSSCNYFMRNILRYHLQWCITTMKWKVILIYDKDLLDVVYILKRIQLNSSYIFLVFYLFLFHLLIHWFFFFFFCAILIHPSHKGQRRGSEELRTLPILVKVQKGQTNYVSSNLENNCWQRWALRMIKSNLHVPKKHDTPIITISFCRIMCINIEQFQID